MIADRLPRVLQGVLLEAGDRAALESSLGAIQSFPPRTKLIRAEAPLDHCRLLLTGIVSGHIDDRQGLRQCVSTHFPGELLDAEGLMLQSLDHDVTTVTACKIAFIEHEALHRMLADHPSLQRKLWQASAIQAAIHRAWLFRLGRLDAVGRIAHFLCETNARLMATGLSDGKCFKLGMTQSDLAEICGLTNIHVNRVMRQLREEGLCVFRSSVVEIADPLRLAARGQFRPDYLRLDSRALLRVPANGSMANHHVSGDRLAVVP